MREFVEKPSPDAIDTNLISAGAYVLEKEVVDLIEPDRNVSIEREIWPQLVGEGLYAYPHEAYWLDIGTPERYLQATFDILEGQCQTQVLERLGDTYTAVGRRRDERGPARPARRHRARDADRRGRARRLARRARRRRDGRARARTIERSVVMQGTEIGRGLRAARVRRRGRQPRSARARTSPAARCSARA